MFLILEYRGVTRGKRPQGHHSEAPEPGKAGRPRLA
jgi:hypothetical protein